MDTGNTFLAVFLGDKSSPTRGMLFPRRSGKPRQKREVADMESLDGKAFRGNRRDGRSARQNEED